MQSFLTWANTAGSHPLLAAAVDALLKSSLLLILAATASLVLGRASAAVRHRLWCLTFAGLLLLPMLSYALPALRIPVLPPVDEPALPTTDIAEPVSPATPDELPAFADITPSMPGESPGGAPTNWPREPDVDPWIDRPAEPLAANVTSNLESASAVIVDPAPPAYGPELLLWIWLAGTALVTLPLLVGLAHGAWLGLRANRITDTTWTGLLDELRERLQLRRHVKLLELKRSIIPMTWGVVRPVVVIPQSAQHWPERLRRFVLLHELAHVKRWDVPFQLLGRMACAVYWFHPLAWYALRRLRIERELACDDCVVTTGERPSDYAEQLLQIVRTCRPAGFASVGVAMARTSHLEGRIRAMFDKARSHMPLSARTARTLSIAAALLVTTVAVVRPAAREPEPVAEIVDVNDSDTAETTQIAAADNGDSSVAAAATPESALATADSPPLQPAAVTEAVEEWQIFRGTVVDTTDQPIGNATIHIVYLRAGKWYAAGASASVVSTLAASPTGEFEFNWPKLPPGAPTDGSESFAAFVTAPGYGFEAPFGGGNKSMKVQLPPMQSLRGRIVDLEGVPVAGATVRVFNVALPHLNADIEQWLADSRDAPAIPKQSQPGSLPPSLEKTRYPGSPNASFAMDFFPTLITDADGRFQLDGIGRDRVAVLLLTGPGLAQTVIPVLSRPLDKPLNSLSGIGVGGPNVMYGADFTFVAAPSAPVRGVVRDVDTHAPIVGATIISNGLAGSTTSLEGFIRATTDSEGRYELLGLPFGKGNDLAIVPGDQPYLNTEPFDLPEIRSLQPIVRDIELPKAIWATGRLFDVTTGEPVQGTLHYVPFRDNTFAERYPQYADQSTYLLGVDEDFRTAADGRFRIPVISGHGVLCARANSEAYRTGYGAEQIEQLAPLINDPNGPLPTFDHLAPAYFHSLVEINPAADVTEIGIDVPVDPGVSLELLFTDAAGQPVTGVTVLGVTTPEKGSATRTDRATAVGLTAGTAVTVVAQQLERKLGARLAITPTRDSGPQTIVLYPHTIVRGRLIDPQNVPISDTKIEVHPYVVGQSSGTAADGGFTVELLAGATYQLFARGKKNNLLTKDLVARPNESIDLGDLVIDPQKQQWDGAVPKRAPIITKSPMAAATPEPATGGADTRAIPAHTITIRGTVLNPAGQSVANATIRAQSPMWATLKPLFPPDWEPPITESKSAADGGFEISFSTQSMGDLSRLNPTWKEIWKKTVIAASAPGFGSAWVTYEELTHPDLPVTLKLVEDLPLQGQVVDLEGAPIAGETIKLSDLHAAENEDLSPWLAAIDAGEMPWTAWKKSPRSVDPQLAGIPETVTADAEGRFEIRGLGRERHLALTFESDVVAHRTIEAATRLMSPLKRLVSTTPDGGYMPVFGARFVFAATPARSVTGTVRDASTGAPLPGVAVESYKFGDYPYSNHRVLKTVTDADGRFRLAGMPKGDGNQILILPNDDQPYLMREFDIPNPQGLDPVDVTIDVHRGVWITGRVTDAASGEPVYARLHYLPYLSNPSTQELPEFVGGNVQGDQLRYQTRSDGTFRLVGLPGPAIVGAECILNDYPAGQGFELMPGPRQENTDYLLTYNNPVWPSPKWPTAMSYIDPVADAESVAVEFRIEAGHRVAFRFVDPDGNPLAGAEVNGRRFHGFEKTATDVFQSLTFGDGQERIVLFRHAERRLGWVQQIKASDAAAEPVVIKLQSVATVTGRLLTATGDPLSGMAVEAVPLPSADFSKHLDPVLTDGEGRFTCDLPPGANYILQGQGGGLRYVVIAKELAIEPGQSLDLGDLRIDSEGNVMEQAAAATPARPAMQKSVDK